MGQEALREQEAQGLLITILFHLGHGERPNETATSATVLQSVLQETEQGVQVYFRLGTGG